MKKVILSKKSINKLFIDLLVVAFISSCGGGGSSLPKNEIIGNAPSIAAEYHSSMAKLKEEEEKIAKKLEGNTDENAWMKAMKDYKEKEDAIEKKKDLAIEKTMGEVKGNMLPITNNNPDVEVKDLKLENINDDNVLFQGIVVVKTPLSDTFLKCQFLDKDNNPIQETSGAIAFSKVWANDKVGEGEHKISVTLSIKDKPESANIAKIEFLAN